MITYEAQLSDMTRAELAELAKAAKIAGRSKMAKAQLIEALIIAKADVLATMSPDVQVFYAEAEAIAEAEAAAKAEIKPGRCLSRIAEPGKNFFQCVREHGHNGDHAMMTPDASPTAQALAETSAARDDAMKAAYEAEGTDRQAYADVKYAIADAAYEAAKRLHREARRAAGDKVKPEPFTFSYDATEGVLIAGALEEKAKAERELSKELRVSHGGVGAAQADNRAALLALAADRIHKPVHKALVRDFDKALTKAEEKPFHRQVKNAIGLRW